VLYETSKWYEPRNECAFFLTYEWRKISTDEDDEDAEALMSICKRKTAAQQKK
jgi:hypothetical protein